jgi:putative NADH-flavin reductase
VPFDSWSMKIALFGGTGNVGRVLLPMTLDAGHEVTLLARDPGTVGRQHPLLTVVNGNALDPDAVDKTLVGAEAVLSTLGGFGDADAIEAGTANIIAAMPAAGVKRLVIVQGFHLRFPGDPDNLGRRIVTVYLNAKDRSLVTRSEAMAAQLRTMTDLDWTLLRIPPVVRGGPTRHTKVGILRLGPWSKVTAGDVGATVLDLLEDAMAVHTAPMVSSG